MVPRLVILFWQLLGQPWCTAHLQHHCMDLLYSDPPALGQANTSSHCSFTTDCEYSNNEVLAYIDDCILVAPNDLALHP